jgi:hypothetical protein
VNAVSKAWFAKVRQEAIGGSATQQDSCPFLDPKVQDSQGFDPFLKIHGDSVPIAAINRQGLKDLASTGSLRQIIYKK